jgi:drug/metabolite transporter (DMT)-like permease
MGALTSIFSLLVGAAGWYYMFYSRAALKLSPVEGEQRNRIRQRCRQANGFVMFLLAVALYAGFNTVDPHTSAQTFITVWFSVFVLLLVVVLLALVDLRLTWRLRHNRRRAAAESQASRKS